MKTLRRFFFFLVLVFGMNSGLVFAQNEAEVDPKIMKEVEELYERKEEVKKFIFQMMERKLAQDMMISLEAKNFSEEEISNVLSGPAFLKFSKDVVTHPITVRHVDRFIENTLRPDRMRKIFLRRKAEFRTAQTTEIVLMLRRLLMEHHLKLDAPKEEEPGLAKRLLASVEAFFREPLN